MNQKKHFATAGTVISTYINDIVTSRLRLSSKNVFILMKLGKSMSILTAYEIYLLTNDTQSIILIEIKNLQYIVFQIS